MNKKYSGLTVSDMGIQGMAKANSNKQGMCTGADRGTRNLKQTPGGCHKYMLLTASSVNRLTINNNSRSCKYDLIIPVNPEKIKKKVNIITKDRQSFLHSKL